MENPKIKRHFIKYLMKQESAGVRVISKKKVPTFEKLQSPGAAPGFLDQDDALLAAAAAAVTQSCHKRGSRSTLETAGYSL